MEGGWIWSARIPQHTNASDALQVWSSSQVNPYCHVRRGYGRYVKVRHTYIVTTLSPELASLLSSASVLHRSAANSVNSKGAISREVGHYHAVHDRVDVHRGVFWIV
jgi:hypothetical protein